MQPTEHLETGLKHKGKPVTTQVVPGPGGGSLVFRCGLKRRRIPLAQILSNVVEPRPEGVTDEDLVDLGALYRRLRTMVFDAPEDVDEKARYRARCATLALVRAMRDERREEAGLPPVQWRGTPEEWEALYGQA